MQQSRPVPQDDRNEDALRLALKEQSEARLRAEKALADSRMLLTTLDQLVAEPTLADALVCLARRACEEIGADTALIFEADQDDSAARLVAQHGQRSFEDADFAVNAAFLGRSRRLLDASLLGFGAKVAGIKSAVVVPIRRPDQPLLAIVCLSFRDAGFNYDRLTRLRKLVKVSVQPLTKLTLAERTAALSALLVGEEPKNASTDAPDTPDRSFQAVTEAIGRLTRGQEMMVSLLNDLLTAKGSDLELALDEAMARLAAHTDADRCQIVRLDATETRRVDHEWVAPGQSSLAQESNDYWDVLLPAALSKLKSGEVIFWVGNPEGVSGAQAPTSGLRSVAMFPIFEADAFVGCLSIDHFDAPRVFMPGEIHLLRSLANAIGAMTLRQKTETHFVAVQAALQNERSRLSATLAALPDLVLEMDGSGRFTDHYSQLNPFLSRIGAALVGRSIDESMPPHIAAIGHDLMAQVREKGRGESQPFLYEIGKLDRRWVKATAVCRDAMLGRENSSNITLFVLRDVTHEVRQAGEITRLSEVAKLTQSFVVMMDAQHRVTWVNKAFEERTGWSLDEIAGKMPTEFLTSPRAEPAWHAGNRRQLEDGKSIQCEFENVTRTGETIWVSSDIQPVFDTDGTVAGYIAVQQDLTQRRRYESDLARAAAAAGQARARLIAAVEALEDGFVLFDSSSKIVLCNERYRNMFTGFENVIRPGATLEDILRHGLMIGAYSEAGGHEEEWLRARLEHHRTSNGPIEIRLRDGRWVRAYDKATPDGGWVGLRTDITALKEAEAKALSDRETAMDAANDGMAISGEDGRFLYTNAAFIRMFGLPADQTLTGQHWSNILGSDIASMIAAKALPQLQSGSSNWRGTIELPPEFQSISQIDVSITLRQDGAFVWVVRDLSERQRDERERTRLSENLQLAQRREVIGQLAAGLAHDFNNLIAAISGSATLIREDSPRDGAAWSNADRILKSASRAEGMVRRLLTLGSRPSHRRRISLAPLMSEAADLLRPALPRTIRLALEIEPEPMMSYVDSTDILQVVLNLAVNARDALFGRNHNTAPAEVRLMLRRARPEELADRAGVRIGQIDKGRTYACLVVADSGDGIGPEQRQKVFTPYFSTKGEKGTGLGLSIVASVVKANGGAISLTESDAKGAEFRVFIPLADDEAEVGDDRPVLASVRGGTKGPTTEVAVATGAPEASVPPQVAENSLTGASILLVDDAEDVLAVFSAMIERAGAEVAPTCDPEAALEVLLEDPDAFDVVVTDFDMGGIDGAQLARKVHAVRPNLPVILITALTDWRSRDTSSTNDQDPNFFAVLGKPVSTEALVATVKAALDSREN